MTKEQIEAHKEVIKWFIDNSDKGVWFKGFMNEWELQTNPHFVEDYLYIQNDEYAEFRKALSDSKTVQQIYGAYCEWKDLDWSDKFTHPIENYRIKPDKEN